MLYAVAVRSPATPARIDVHQHIWTAPLLDALARRDRLPFVRHADGIAVLHCAGEQAWAVDTNAEHPARRADLLRADGIDHALIALSSPIGIEALPRDEAQELIDAHLAGAEALGDEFGVWGPVALDRPDPDDVDALLRRGCIGISLPAGALALPSRSCGSSIEDGAVASSPASASASTSSPIASRSARSKSQTRSP